nr:AMP-binding protein [uncultured Pseudogulbenkiania sp.]
MNWPAQTLAQVLTAQVAARPDAAALVTGSSRLSYRQLADNAWQVARALLASGIRRGDFVGVLMGNDEYWVETFFGAALIGAVTVPVNTRFKASEIQFCLGQSDVKMFLLADRFLKIKFTDFLREAEPEVDIGLPGQNLPKLQRVVVIGDDIPAAATSWQDFLAQGVRVSQAEVESAAEAVTPDDLLLIQFTSGTTAFPKGVMLTHDNMLRNARAVGLRLGVRGDDRYFNCRPFFHVAGSTLSLLVSLTSGACLATLPTFDAAEALAMLERERCTLISGNDTLFQMLMAHKNFDVKRLHLRGGWAAAGPETMKRVVEELGMRDVCWAYGLSEASPNVVINDWRDPLELRIAGLAKPHDGIEVRIADPDSNQAQPPEAVGEIQVRGWSVMRGYYKNPEANAKVFTSDGWLRTGDLGALTAEGRLKLIGRLKDVFRVGGENVAPAEVEEALLAHPAVAIVQVVGVPDVRLGEVPAAFVVLNPGAQLTPQQLIDWAKPRMANFRTPRYAAIVDNFDAIGMTASGKIQKNKLREYAAALFAQGQPEVTP